VEGLPAAEHWYQIVDLTGRIVASGQRNEGSGMMTLATGEYANGMYLLQWHNATQQGSTEFLIAR
jgi:hypothetical protein